MNRDLKPLLSKFKIHLRRFTFAIMSPMFTVWPNFILQFTPVKAQYVSRFSTWKARTLPQTGWWMGCKASCCQSSLHKSVCQLNGTVGLESLLFNEVFYLVVFSFYWPLHNNPHLQKMIQVPVNVWNIACDTGMCMCCQRRNIKRHLQKCEEKCPLAARNPHRGDDYWRKSSLPLLAKLQFGCLNGQRKDCASRTQSQQMTWPAPGMCADSPYAIFMVPF